MRSSYVPNKMLLCADYFATRNEEFNGQEETSDAGEGVDHRANERNRPKSVEVHRYIDVILDVAAEEVTWDDGRSLKKARMDVRINRVLTYNIVAVSDVPVEENAPEAEPVRDSLHMNIAPMALLLFSGRDLVAENRVHVGYSLECGSGHEGAKGNELEVGHPLKSGVDLN
jgi:hypothetical protein